MRRVRNIGSVNLKWLWRSMKANTMGIPLHKKNCLISLRVKPGESHLPSLRGWRYQYKAKFLANGYERVMYSPQLKFLIDFSFKRNPDFQFHQISEMEPEKWETSFSVDGLLITAVYTIKYSLLLCCSPVSRKKRGALEKWVPFQH